MVHEATERCWQTGEWSDECSCELCEHRYECSGSDADDED